MIEQTPLFLVGTFIDPMPFSVSDCGLEREPAHSEHGTGSKRRHPTPSAALKACLSIDCPRQVRFFLAKPRDKLRVRSMAYGTGGVYDTPSRAG